MAILGQFRDLDEPDHFVWLRGFDGMAGRPEALTSFYGGPVWKARCAQANATMVDVSNVLLLRPVSSDQGFPPPAAGRLPAAGGAVPPPSRILATICSRSSPFDQAFAGFFDRHVHPVLAGAGAQARGGTRCCPACWKRSRPRRSR